MSRASRKAVTLSGIRDQLDSIEAKVDAQAKLLQMLVPHEHNEQRREKSQIVATNEPEYKPSSHGITNPRATSALRSIYNMPIRQSVIPPPRVDPNLGTLS